MGCKSSCMSLRPIALGVALGFLSGLCMMVFAWCAWRFGYGSGFIMQYASIYPGYTASLMGGLVGLAWGFLEGFISGVLLAWFYNLCVCCCPCKCGCCAKSKE